MSILSDKTISIENLLPPDYETIVGEALRGAVVSWFNHLSDDDKARIISNMGYYNMFNIIRNEFPDVGDRIKEEVVNHINNSVNYGFYIFGQDAYNRSRVGQKIIDDCIVENKEIIREKTSEAISELSKKDIKQFMVNFQYKFKQPQ